MAANAEVPSSSTTVLPESLGAVARRTLVVRPLTEQVRAEVQSGRSVLVVGDAGVGKTHLVTAALAHLWIGTPTSPMPTVVSVSGATCPTGIPLGALEPLLGDVAISSLGSFARAVDALAASLRARSRGGPVILRVEDAHLLDRGSSQALAWMVQQHEVQLVATARSSAVSQSPWLELWKDDVVERIDVPPFTLAEVQRWLVGELGGQVSLDTVRRVWSETSGNPFHLGEVVAGALEQQGGAWVWVGGATPGRRLLDVVAHDMSRLSGDARVALEIAALVCPVSLGVLLDMVSRPVVEELSRVGLVSLSPRLTVAGEGDVTVDLAHALYAEAVRSGVPRARRREVLERVAGLANTGHRTGAALVRSVALALDCDLAVEPSRLDAAVDAAFELQQPDTAIRLLTSALRQTQPGDLRTAELALQRADAWWHLDDAGRASRDLTDVFEVLWETVRADAPTVQLMVAATALRARIAYHRDGDLDQALRAFDIAARWIVERGGEHVGRGLRELETARLTRLGYGGRPRLDDACAVLLDPAADSAAVPLAAPTIVGLAQSGRFTDAAHLAARSAQLAGAHHDQYRWGRGEVAVAAFLTTLWSGDVTTAEGVVDALDQESNAAVDWVAVHVTRGLIGIARGSWMQAHADLHAASARHEHSDMGGVAVYSRAAEALAAAASGDAATARTLLAENADATARAMAGVDGEVQLLRADTLAWLRDPRAVDEARALVGWARERGLWRVELEALHRSADRRRPGTRPRGVDPEVQRRVRELAPLVDGPRAAAIVRHVQAQSAGDDDLVRIAERELNRCGLWLPPVETTVSLTRREQEIASLAAGGLTSRAIASRLTLSVRTVDSHLARVFAKTGVHSREGLSAVLR
ncbi:hypothetical protein ASD16_11955 [Cellulomonas sp. Root485]|uniref:helix-turn-helix transcriptional regulator n=1 Tax=Cellulomonas sp. Root485 TaxID=1736546 RepID=UPI0006FB0DC0|nr:LuxR family transcriptional regulator [Cellulomonas sp. Root485]KQY23263.1 hypothetical protein ASD16_11955 [Cellulomonas sp. Root485]